MCHFKKKKNGGGIYCSNLNSVLLVMKPLNMELDKMGIPVKVILSARYVLRLACTCLYSFLKIPSWNVVSASAFCLPHFVQMLFEVIQLK